MQKFSFFITSVLFFSIGFISIFFHQPFHKECANSITCIENLEAEVTTNTEAIFLGEKILVPDIQFALDLPPVSELQPKEPSILGETEPRSEQNKKHIFVDLSKQTLYAYEGTQLFFKTLISSGKWGRTPTGEFSIWIKIRATKMSGGSGNDYYYLPNVPYVMYFYNSKIPKSRGFGLHGTYWHNNFGHEMSHGCVNLRTIDAKLLYEWTTPVTTANTTYASIQDPGTAVTICNSLEISDGVTPKCLD